MKNHCITAAILLLTALACHAQQQTYDFVSYTPPAGWNQQTGNGFIAYSRIDGSSWAQIAIYEHASSEGDIQSDFDKQWKELAVGSREISAPEKTQPGTDKDWTVMSGSGTWQYNGTNVACILTVYSNNSITIAVLCNATAKPYLKEYQKLIGTLDIMPQPAQSSQSSQSPQSSQSAQSAQSAQSPQSSPAVANRSSIVGRWCYNLLETSGYMNGMPMYSAGYFRKEYRFNADGTYQFRLKNWSTTIKEILYVNETGTWSVTGNQLTITPKRGGGEWWSKAASGRTTEWGTRQKPSTWRLQAVTYTFELHYYEGQKETHLMLNPTSSNEHDASASTYTPLPDDKPLIDAPPDGLSGKHPESFTN